LTRSRFPKLFAAGLLGLVLTTFISAIWGGLLATNIQTSPNVPWAVVVMAAFLWFAWQYAGGRWWPRRTSETRRLLLRARSVDCRVFAWAVGAGTLALIGLTGMWIVLFQTGLMRGNTLPDYSRYPGVTVAAALVMASVLGGLTEEAAFRGYFQGMLERECPAALAITIAALVMAPGHALTQGLAWPTFAFYLLVDVMLGVTAYLCNAVWPGAVVHAVGLLIFFTVIWPSDSTRPLADAAIRDGWFWIHAGQAAIFLVLATLAFFRLARLTRTQRITGEESPAATA
jgi:membrane protease YdiL (CAAX protease family)